MFRQWWCGYTLPLEEFDKYKLKFCGSTSDSNPAVRGSRRGKARCRRDRSRLPRSSVRSFGRTNRDLRDRDFENESAV